VASYSPRSKIGGADSQNSFLVRKRCGSSSDKHSPAAVALGALGSRFTDKEQAMSAPVQKARYRVSSDALADDTQEAWL
jgi:hypothetical protein